MTQYRLTVVKKMGGNYQIFHHDKMEPKEITNFPCLINQILSYSINNSQLFLGEPVLIDFPKEEETAVRDIRQLILEKGRLEYMIIQDPL